MAGRVKGAPRIRAILRGMPTAFRQEMTDVLDSGGQKLKAEMASRAPRRTGALAQGISYKVYPQSLRLKVGLLDTKPGRSALFYGRIQDLGRRAQVVRVTRRKGVQPYLLRVRAMSGKAFVTGRFPDLRDTIQSGLRGIFTRALARISGGGS